MPGPSLARIVAEAGDVHSGIAFDGADRRSGDQLRQFHANSYNVVRLSLSLSCRERVALLRRVRSDLTSNAFLFPEEESETVVRPSASAVDVPDGTSRNLIAERGSGVPGAGSCDDT